MTTSKPSSEVLELSKWSKEFNSKTYIIKDKLCLILFYYFKKDHVHEMYDKHRDIDAMVAHVEPILDELMQFLDIDPKAKPY
jgi:hypothetical protein